MTKQEILDLQYKNLNQFLITREEYKIKMLLAQRTINEIKNNIKHLKKSMSKEVDGK
jgi:hypothetical protein